MRGLADRGVLVSGGTSGIGLAAAARFLEEGCRVFLTGHDDGVGQAIADLRAVHPAAVLDGALCDVVDRDAVAATIARAEAEVGPLTVLANNAGISHRSAFLDLDADDWQRTLEVNLTGMFHVAQEFCRMVVAAGRPASVINMASTNALGGEEDYAHYNASKGGVLQLTRTMAVELGQHGIRVNALCPGYVDTPLNRQIAAALPPDFLERYLRERVPLRRAGAPEDIAAAYAFLASDDAAFITGAAFVVDGGQLAVM